MLPCQTTEMSEPEDDRGHSWLSLEAVTHPPHGAAAGKWSFSPSFQGPLPRKGSAQQRDPPYHSLGVGAQLGQCEKQERDGDTTGMGCPSFPWALPLPKKTTSCTCIDYALTDLELKLLTEINQTHH